MQNYPNTLSQDVFPYLIKDKFTDIKFVFGNPESQVHINAHKFVLAGRSKLFESLLQEKTLSELPITDCSFQSFKTLIEYLYLDDI